jgi:hypothetical protein
MRRLMKSYEWLARKKKIFWNLSADEFHQLTQGACTYCGEPPAHKSRFYVYNGIDRKDNARGYEIGNCVPCCGLCNMTKGDRYSYAEMLCLGKTVRVIRDSR